MHEFMNLKYSLLCNSVQLTVDMVKVAILGAGINGLTSAVRIKEKYKHFQVVVIASEFTPDTTGDGSGGLWFPYLCGKTPEYLIGKWGCETYKFLHELWLDGACEISLMPMYEFSKNKQDIYKRDWMDLVFGYQRLNEKQMDYFNRLYSAKYSAGQTFVTFVIPPPKLLGYFQRRFLKANGELIKAKLSSIHDAILRDYDIIVNCTGIGARFIVPDDRMMPIRGQVAKVQAPWIAATVVDNSIGRYIIPNADFCILGGTHQHEYNTNVEEKDVEHIINGCEAMIPGLKHAKLLTHWVGLRPGRDSVRIEKEERDGKLYIHNYGHGGSGLTLFWGCGNEVMNILDMHLKNKKIFLKSKF